MEIHNWRLFLGTIQQQQLHIPPRASHRKNSKQIRDPRERPKTFVRAINSAARTRKASQGRRPKIKTARERLLRPDF
eukprot:scaffold112660_cov29-Tisochrysis_lutea.AAC.5